MAQRVYLIPIKPQVVSAVNSLVRATPTQEPDIWNKLRQYGRRQARLSQLSLQYARGLDAAAFRKAGRESDYYTFTNSRPYLVTAKMPGEAAGVVRALCTCRNAQEAAAIFEAQVQPLGTLWHRPEEESASLDTHALWQSPQRGIAHLRGMWQSYQARRPFVVQTMKRVIPPDAPFEGFSPDETEAKEIPWANIPSLYGNQLGGVLGQIAGLCEPTWWMGRNYWVALLCFSKLSGLRKLKFSRLQKTIAALGESPAGLFSPIALQGFEEGFDLGCPAYSSGILFSADHMNAWLQSLQTARTDWEALSEIVTGYPTEIIPGMVGLIEEAVTWAHMEGCGLMEGDELVGSMGARG